MAQDACGIAEERGGVMSDKGLISSMMQCPRCGIHVNAADPYNQHVCHPPQLTPEHFASFRPTMTTLESIKQDVGALREARTDDERWRKLVLERLEITETLRANDREFAENAATDLSIKIDKSHADLQAGIISLKGQLDGIRDGLADELRQIRLSTASAIGNAFINFEHKVSGAKPSTKRKPRGRRK
jgi:hypothetical protein